MASEYHKEGRSDRRERKWNKMLMAKGGAGNELNERGLQEPGSPASSYKYV